MYALGAAWLAICLSMQLKNVLKYFYKLLKDIASKAGGERVHEKST